MKQCKRCGEMKTLAQFNNKRRNRDGKYHLCRRCACEERGTQKQTLQEQFESRFIPVTESGCWLWLGSTTRRNGYGSFGIGRKDLRAHRVSWELYNGPVPEGMHVLHKCDVRSCVNPRHLFLGSNKDNMNDKANKGRQAKGTKIHTAKLNTESVLEIRKLLGVVRTKDLAEKYNVLPASIWCIKRGKTWRHVMSE